MLLIAPVRIAAYERLNRLGGYLASRAWRRGHKNVIIPAIVAPAIRSVL
jgi:hypothetical protein